MAAKKVERKGSMMAVKKDDAKVVSKVVTRAVMKAALWD